VAVGRLERLRSLERAPDPRRLLGLELGEALAASFTLLELR